MASVVHQETNPAVAIPKPFEGEEPPATCSQWDKDKFMLFKGVHELFSNQLTKAEETFKAGMYPRTDLQGDDKDNSGGFALQYALVAVIRGVSSLADDALDECLVRLKDADKLTAATPDWVGKTVVRGITVMEIGFVQCIKHKLLKGVWNILRSWQWVKHIRKDGLTFDGKEKDVVRSAALLTVGIFELVLSLLPSSLMRAASFMSGFQGSRSTGLDTLWQCYQERGVLAPWAALIWVSYQIDTKTFLCEKQTEEDFAKCNEIFTWVRSQYGTSVFFSTLEADMHACKRDTVKAMEITMESSAFVGELRVIQWAIAYKTGVYALSELNWTKAGEAFRASIRVYTDVGRRSMVPFMAGYSALSFLTSGTEEDLKQAQEMLSVIQTYADMKDKTNWGRQDRWAFALPSELDEGAWPLLLLAEVMSINIRCTFYMHPEALAQLCETLETGIHTREPAPSAFMVARMHMVCAEIRYQLSQYEQCLAACDQGLSHVSKLAKDQRKFGVVPMLVYLRARALAALGDLPRAKEGLSQLNKHGRAYTLYPMVAFKAASLRRDMGSEKAEFTKLAVGARNKLVTNVDVPEGESIVDVEWYVEAHTVEFSAVFVPEAATESNEISKSVDQSAFLTLQVVKATKYTADDGMMCVRLVASAGGEGSTDDVDVMGLSDGIEQLAVGEDRKAAGNAGTQMHRASSDASVGSSLSLGTTKERRLTSVVVRGPGRLELTWNNSFSRLRGKKVLMRSTCTAVPVDLE